MDGPGRPTVMDENTLRILENAFSNDATDIQACFLANIATSTLYKYQVDNPGYLERKQALKDMIKYQAKRIVKEAMFDKDKGTDTAKWYLERKDKGEFSSRQEMTGADGTAFIPILSNIKKQDALLGNNITPQNNGDAEED